MEPLNLVKLYRLQIGKGEGLDVSRKSGTGLGLCFAPPWSWIVESKAGAMPWDRYRYLYQGLLSEMPIEKVQELYAYGVECGFELGLLCYCKSGYHCHANLLIEWLVKSWPDWFEVKL
jgi:hypothetical protein